jgi:hypothetical protein
LSSGILNNISTQVSTETSIANQATNSLTQLNNAQANIAGVSTGSGPGVPVAVLEQQAAQSLITYNALLQIMEVMDQMLSNLISIVGGGASSSGTLTFQSK